MRTPEHGAVGFHPKGAHWFINIYVWRTGPWRFSWTWHRWGTLGVTLETPRIPNAYNPLGRALGEMLFRRYRD